MKLEQRINNVRRGIAQVFIEKGTALQAGTAPHAAAPRTELPPSQNPTAPERDMVVEDIVTDEELRAKWSAEYMSTFFKAEVFPLNVASLGRSTPIKHEHSLEGLRESYRGGSALYASQREKLVRRIGTMDAERINGEAPAILAAQWEWLLAQQKPDGEFSLTGVERQFGEERLRSLREQLASADTPTEAVLM